MIVDGATLMVSHKFQVHVLLLLWPVLKNPLFPSYIFFMVYNRSKKIVFIITLGIIFSRPLWLIRGEKK